MLLPQTCIERILMDKKLGVYLHIPFCRSKCPYCDFFSSRGSEAEYDSYTAALTDRIKEWSDRIKRTADTVYFGGGTPSVLGTDRLCSVLDSVRGSFGVKDGAEITLEVNPESGRSLDYSKLAAHGFNRLSIGLQSANENELRQLGRLHRLDEVAQTVSMAQSSGINNISLDLMLGIPFQTKESLRRSIDYCASLDARHISAYLLKIEEGTVFDRRRDKLILPDDDAQSELYLFAVDYMSSLGYEQYEISNFAKPGFESRHNTLYWRLDDYIGIGPSAHSFLDGKRFYYPRSMEEFLNGSVIDDGTGGDEKEFIMLSLRLKSGLDYSSYENRFARPLPRRVLDSVERFTSLGYMESDGSHASLTPKGFLISNYIISELTEE